MDNKCEITGDCHLVFFLNEDVDNGEQEIDESKSLQSFKNVLFPLGVMFF